VDTLSDFDRQQIENLCALMHKEQDLLYQIERRRTVANPLQREELGLQEQTYRPSPRELEALSDGR
jgi:hypothetical protein